MNKSTAEVLEGLMKKNNLNPNQLAERTGGSSATIGRILKGSRPSKKTVGLLSKYFNISPDYFLTGNEIYLKEESLKIDYKELDNQGDNPPTQNEIERFFDILYNYKGSYENMELFKVLKESIENKAQKRLLIELSEMKEEKERKENVS